MPGLLNSATTIGMPLTNSTASGMTCPRPLVSSTLNWLMTRKSLFAGCSKSMISDRLRAALLPIRQSVGHRALEEQFSGRLVDLHQPVPGSLLQIANGAAQCALVQPRLAVAQIELPQRRREPVLEQNLAEARALGQLRHVRVAFDPLPAHRFELFAERLFDQVVFPLDFAHGGLFRAGARRGVSVAHGVAQTWREKWRKCGASSHNCFGFSL